MTSNAMEEGIGPDGEKSSSTTPETPSRRASAEMESETPAEMIHLLLYLSIGLQKIAAVEVPVWCEVLGIQGKMRLRIQLVPNAPFVKHVGFTLMGQPKLELKAKPLGRKMGECTHTGQKGTDAGSVLSICVFSQPSSPSSTNQSSMQCNCPSSPHTSSSRYKRP